MLMQSCFLNNYLCRIIDIYYEDTLSELMNSSKNNDEAKVKTYITYVTAGVKEAIVAWIEGRIECSPDEIASDTAKLIELSSGFIN
mgnify:CR=1 FL=1